MRRLRELIKAFRGSEEEGNLNDGFLPDANRKTAGYLQIFPRKETKSFVMNTGGRKASKKKRKIAKASRKRNRKK